jgi:hypothetical protein
VREHIEREIEAVFRDRTGRECLFVPSGRLALYLAFRMWLSPGESILMSPLNDDVVFFTVLAAGLHPVMAPVSPKDGNIDPDAILDQTWSRIGAVLTTNLYGLPDAAVELRRRCDLLGLPLIEDAAHAVETQVEGRPIGTFGVASAFSFSKRLGAVGGGALAFSEPDRRPELLRLRDQLTKPKPLRHRTNDLARPVARSVLRTIHLSRWAHRMGRRLGLVERTAYRMPLRLAQLGDALAVGEFDQFDPWLRVDLHDYRYHPGERGLEQALIRLRKLDSERARSCEGVERLCGLAGSAPGACEGMLQPFFRVPLLVENRDAVVPQLERQGINAYYIFDPPLDDYAGSALAEPSPDPRVARWWARHVLPVDPLDADRLLHAVKAGRIHLQPAWDEPKPSGRSPAGR